MLQDDDNCEVVPGTEFVVSRTAHRNNSSVYYIGSRKSSFGEVTDLLKGKGIDLDNNRFLILQARAQWDLREPFHCHRDSLSCFHKPTSPRREATSLQDLWMLPIALPCLSD